MSMSDYIQYLQGQDLIMLILMACGFAAGYPLVLFMRNKAAFEGFHITPRVPLWFPLALSALLPLRRLVNVPLWYDETFTVAAASGSLSGLSEVIISDVHTGLHYMLIHMWGHVFGFGQISVRIPSLIAGVLCVYMSYRLARIVFSENTASWAALLVALFPAVVHYSAEARYPIFLLLSVLFALHEVERKNKYAYILCAMPAWLHIVAAPFSVFLLWRGRSYFTWRDMLVGFLASCLFLPLAIIQSADVINGFWLKLRFPLFHITQNFFVQQNELIYILLVVLGVYLALSWELSWRWGGLVWIVPLSVWILSAVWTPVYLFRVMLPAVVLLIISSVLLIKWRVARAVVLVLFIGSLGMYYSGIDRLDTREALRACEGADYVVTTSTGLYILVRYHSELPVYSYGINTNSQYLSDAAKQAIDMKRPPANGDGCMLMYDNFETEAAELVFAAHLTPVASFPAGNNTLLKVLR